MKKLLIAASVLFGCSVYAQDSPGLKSATSQDVKTKGTQYGKAFDDQDAISVSDLIKKTGDKELDNVVVYGKIEEVCQAEGCWMRVFKENDEKTSMLVKFKDHSFVIPKDLAGKQVVFKGRAYQATVSVKMLQHYVEDAGKSKDEIAKITEPSNELAFEATGLIIK